MRTGFAHCSESGNMRRMYARGTDNVRKVVLVQAGAFNIGLLLRMLSGWGKLPQAQGRRFCHGLLTVGDFRG